MKVYAVMRHRWELSSNRFDNDMYESDIQTELIYVCTTVDLAVSKANKVSKDYLDELKSLDGDDFEGWDYCEEVREDELKIDELLITDDVRDACWFYLHHDGGVGVSIKEMDLTEEQG